MPDKTTIIATNPDVSKPTAANFPIVGMGASAGGLEAFEQFFHNAPVECGLAFVLVSHLDPTHASLLTEILQRSTKLPVIEAMDQMRVEPNHVYIIPPNRDMEIFHGELQLSIPTAVRGQRLPIDHFLRSLADDQAENAIAIILSGTGSDGTLGARAILGAGGITIAQDPTTAKYDGMPTSVIAAGYATHTLPVDVMWAVLQTDINRFILHAEPIATAQSVSSMKRVLMQLRTVTGHDFSLYKQSTIGRRIERRMMQHNIEDIEVYVRYLKENREEVFILFKELLINVTSFFRDALAFELLKTDILPLLCKDKTDDSVFRVWVAGCSTGEEAYSIAMLLREYMDETHQLFKVQIYSTDLDDEVISRARTGFYALNIAQDVTPERLRRFFTKEETGYRIRKDIREMVVFAIQNVIKDPPFTKLDLLSCRNVMIYLGAELQERLIPIFHYALNPNGVLFLSPSEGIGNHTELFSVINRKWKFYRAINTLASTRLLIAHTPALTEPTHTKPLEKVAISKELKSSEAALAILADCFAPASVITDFNGDILYVHGDTGRYLRPARGTASLNIVEMARDGLNLELRAAIQRATSNSSLTLNREIQVKTNGGFSAVHLSVRPLPATNEAQKQLLVSFQDIITPKKPVRKRASKSAEVERIEELEQDLIYLKESYQVSIEEQQAFNEELKSTNEEMQSTNEELQSTNEELETAREELQSVNEELITVNSELQGKIEQLAYMQNDMKNLLDNIHIGIIFLDNHLIIRRFTREATRFYRLVNSDVGRPLIDIKSVMGMDDLLAAAQTVLDSLVPYECELLVNNDTWIAARIQPYRTLDNMIDGVVLTFTDITLRMNAIAERNMLGLAEDIVNSIREPFLVLDDNLLVISASPSFYNAFQVNMTDIVNHSLYELSNQQWNITALREQLDKLVHHNQAFEGYILEHNFPVIGYCKLRLNARRIAVRTGALQLILLSMELIA